MSITIIFLSSNFDELQTTCIIDTVIILFSNSFRNTDFPTMIFEKSIPLPCLPTQFYNTVEIALC